MEEDAGAVCAGLEASLAQWVPKLTPAAAAAAMFAVGLHGDELAAAAAAKAQALPQLSVPVVVLGLFQRAKSSGDALVFDMALAAAAEAAELTGDWHRGESIVAAAQKAVQQAAGEGSRGSSSGQWMPVLPAALSALLAVLVHTQGVAAAGKLLLAELEEQLGVQQGQGRASAPAGRKGKAASAAAKLPAAAAAAVPAAPAAKLLSLPVVNGFLAAAVKVAVAAKRDGSEEEAEAAAQAAVEVFTEVFKLQVAAVSLGAAGAAAVPAAGHSSVRPNADSWSSVLQLHGCLGSFQQVSNIVLAACRQQLPGVTTAYGLQGVLAGAAAAFNGAGKHTAAVQLLDGLVAAGVTAVSHPTLAQELWTAAGEAEQELVDRLLQGDSLYDLPDVGQSGGTGSGEIAVTVQLVQLDAAQALQRLRLSLRSA